MIEPCHQAEAAVAAAAPSGALPEWDLSDLYPRRTRPR